LERGEDLMIGKTISHYRILEKLGEGGMGVVYKAQDTKLDRTVALKFLPPALTGDPEAKERFVHEARSASALDHQNICTIHEINEAEGHAFIAMAYVEGHTLKDKIASAPLPINEAVSTAIQVAEGLEEAHEKGIVHRDIKPANIMMTPKGQAKIMDFGLAKSRGQTQLTKAETTLGTFAYMSPEQARGEDVDSRTDIWSLGAVLYEMVTGRQPFQGDYEQAVIYSILNEEPEPPTALRSGIPLELERIVLKCLRKDVKDRYQGIPDLIADLRQVGHVSASSVAAPAVTQPGRRSPWPWLAAAIVILALAAYFLPRYLGPSDEEAAPGKKMLVVLPFENLGPSEDEYFADGTTDAITARLASLHGLGVISRQSAVQYKGSDKSLRQIGEELGVDYVLEGTVQRERPGDLNSRVRVIPQLVQVSDDTHLWAAAYDENLAEVFRVQSEIAERVAQQLHVTLLDTEREALDDRPTDNLEAYESYLRGSHYLERRLQEEYGRLALGMYEKAAELDPDFAEAWAGVSRASTWLHWTLNEPGAVERARIAGERAVRLAPDSPEAHVALGYVRYYGHRDYDGAMEHFAEARRLSPNDADALMATGYILRRQGKWDEALKCFEDAYRVNPRHYALVSGGLGTTSLRARRYAEAEKYLDRAIALAPEMAVAYGEKALLCLVWRGDADGAREVMNEGIDRISAKESPFLFGQSFHICRILPELNDRFQKTVLSPGPDATPGVISASTYTVKAYLAHVKGDVPLARAWYDSALALMPADLEDSAHEAWMHVVAALAYAGLGDSARAIEEAGIGLKALPISADAIEGPELAEGAMEVYASVGEYDLALELLEVLTSVPSNMSVPLIRLDPLWDPMREDPRFVRLLEEYGEE
jgi:non-specific serine/threonine protein kinase